MQAAAQAARPRVSVCIATFNGAAFLAEQIESILGQLAADDEVVVVDDCSRDATLDILRGFADPRIRLHSNERNRGIVPTFERAMSLATGDVILLSDQDDRWLEGRVGLLVDALATSGAEVASSNTSFTDRDGCPIDFAAERLAARDSTRHLQNVLRMFAGTAGYYGCAMGLRRSFLSVVLPMPRFVESHDLWIALAANLCRRNVHLDANTVARRVHGANASLIRRSLYLKLRSRIILAVSIVVLWWRRRALAAPASLRARACV
jgi:glycosyltransferase involved in cell wall biosynthesis